METKVISSRFEGMQPCEFKEWLFYQVDETFRPHAGTGNWVVYGKLTAPTPSNSGESGNIHRHTDGYVRPESATRDNQGRSFINTKDPEIPLVELVGPAREAMSGTVFEGWLEKNLPVNIDASPRDDSRMAGPAGTVPPKVESEEEPKGGVRVRILF